MITIESMDFEAWLPEIERLAKRTRIARSHALKSLIERALGEPVEFSELAQGQLAELCGEIDAARAGVPTC
jgi:hypothetical protein